MSAAHRYVAYTSDIGESFRPVSHPRIVTAAYGISWLYLGGDVLNEGYKAYISNQATLRGGLPVTEVPALLKPVHAIHTRRDISPPMNIQPTNKPAGTANSIPESKKMVATAGEPQPSNQLQPVGGVPFLEDYKTVMVQRAVFQSLASMALPAFTIHSVFLTFSPQ
jgi:mitochondrial fission process protein 1